MKNSTVKNVIINFKNKKMGVYANTNFTIECKSEEIAKEVIKVLEDKTKKSDKWGNTFGTQLELDHYMVQGFEESDRYQNLSYRCQEIWNAIKDIKGVKSLYAPFMMEGDGEFFENEELMNPVRSGRKQR